MVESNLQKAVWSWQSLIGLSNLIWLPRLTAGIYALTSVMSAKKVIVPNNCCLNVVYGVLLGGAEPVFCEIDIKTGSLNVNACKELLERTKAEMVVHVHLFGLYSDRLPIYKLCRRFGAMYFEDGACWFAPVPQYEILPASCLGLSFGTKKIFELGGEVFCAAPKLHWLMKWESAWNYCLNRQGHCPITRASMAIWSALIDSQSLINLTSQAWLSSSVHCGSTRRATLSMH